MADQRYYETASRHGGLYLPMSLNTLEPMRSFALGLVRGPMPERIVETWEGGIYSLIYWQTPMVKSALQLDALIPETTLEQEELRRILLRHLTPVDLRFNRLIHLKCWENDQQDWCIIDIKGDLTRMGYRDGGQTSDRNRYKESLLAQVDNIKYDIHRWQRQPKGKRITIFRVKGEPYFKLAERYNDVDPQDIRLPKERHITTGSVIKIAPHFLSGTPGHPDPDGGLRYYQHFPEIITMRAAEYKKYPYILLLVEYLAGQWYLNRSRKGIVTRNMRDILRGSGLDVKLPRFAKGQRRRQDQIDSFMDTVRDNIKWLSDQQFMGRLTITDHPTDVFLTTYTTGPPKDWYGKDFGGRIIDATGKPYVRIPEFPPPEATAPLDLTGDDPESKIARALYAIGAKDQYGHSNPRKFARYLIKYGQSPEHIAYVIHLADTKRQNLHNIGGFIVDGVKNWEEYSNTMHDTFEPGCTIDDWIGYLTGDSDESPDQRSERVMNEILDGIGKKVYPVKDIPDQPPAERPNDTTSNSQSPEPAPPKPPPTPAKEPTPKPPEPPPTKDIDAILSEARRLASIDRGKPLREALRDAEQAKDEAKAKAIAAQNMIDLKLKRYAEAQGATAKNLELADIERLVRTFPHKGT